MTRRLGMTMGIIAGFFCMAVFWWAAMAVGGDQSAKVKIPEGVYIELTRDFYETLKADADGVDKVYTDDPSNRYLRQIAVSTKFLVETNLQILRQQEEIRHLLQSVLMNKQK